MARWSFGLVVATLGLAVASPAWAKEPGAQRKQRDLIGGEETRGAPPGFHAEQRPRYGLIIGGAATVGVGGLMVLTGLRQRAELAANTTPQAPGSGGEFFILFGGAAMVVGVPLLAYGLLSPRDVYVRDSVATLSLGISATRGGALGRMAFAF